MHRWIYFQKLKRKYQSLSVHSGILTSDDSVETWWIGSLWYTEVDLGLCFLVWSCGLGEVKQLGCFSHWGCHSGWLDHLDDIVIRIRWNSNSQKTWGCDTPSRNLWGFSLPPCTPSTSGGVDFNRGLQTLQQFLQWCHVISIFTLGFGRVTNSIPEMNISDSLELLCLRLSELE